MKRSRCKMYRNCCLLVMLCASSSITLAQEKTQTAQQVAGPPPALPSLETVRVLKVHSRHGEKESADPTVHIAQAGLGDIITLDVQDLQNLLSYADCKSLAGATVPGCIPQRIALFLDSREIIGLVPESRGVPKEPPHTLQFHLQRTSDNDEAWADLIGAPSLDREKFYYRKTAVSIGLAKGSALASDVTSENFVILRVLRGWFSVCAAFALLLVASSFVLGAYTSILRDAGPDPGGGHTGWVFKKKKRRPYSLARCQMAFWFLLVIPGFLFIWLTTGAFNTITAGVLALIGIGSGTLLGAAILDISHQQGSKTELAELDARSSGLQSAITAAALAPPAAGANQAALAADLQAKSDEKGVVDKRRAELQTVTAAKASDWFLIDILTDNDGISFHRFQMVVWTLVLGILFVHQTWSRLSMPDFDATLLALMGISAGTYLGFKIPKPTS